MRPRACRASPARNSQPPARPHPGISCAPPVPQICCHASLAPGEDPSFLAQQPAAGAKLTPELAAQLVELLRAGLDEECPVCLSELAQPCITLCKHIFCKR